MPMLSIIYQKGVGEAALPDEELILSKNDGGEHPSGLETFSFRTKIPVEQGGVEAFDEGTQGGGRRAGGLVIGLSEAVKELFLNLGIEGGSTGEGKVENELVVLARTRCLTRGGCEVEAGQRFG
jgi:hypothetical protein